MADEEQRKKASRAPHDHHLDQAMFETDGSSEDEDDDVDMSELEDDDNTVDEDHLHFGIEDEELEYSEDYDLTNYEDIEEDDIDPDELSYEELIALGEAVGVESRGLSEAEISTYLHPSTFESLTSKTLIDRCVVCQIEYNVGDELVALPCDHPYHPECITSWLQIKKVCPICNEEVSSAKKHNTLHSRL